jgi:hypothetical protein
VRNENAEVSPVKNSVAWWSERARIQIGKNRSIEGPSAAVLVAWALLLLALVLGVRGPMAPAWLLNKMTYREALKGE